MEFYLTLKRIFFNWKIIALHVMLVSAVQQLESDMVVCTNPLPLAPPSHLHPPLSVIAQRPAGLPVLRSSSPLAVCFTHDSVYISMLLSHLPHPLLPCCAHMPLFCFYI